MLLRCKINDEEYDVCQGVPFSEEYNETLDSGTIIIDQVYKLQNLRPYDDVVIWDADYEYLGYNEEGEPLFAGYTFESWDVLSGFPKYKEGKVIFFKHLLVDAFSEDILNLCGRENKKSIYKYKIQLFSETKGLEVVQLPNLSITEPLKMSKKKSVWEYMNKYVDLYSPKYKRRKKDGDGFFSNEEWEFVPKYKLDKSLKETFDNVYSPDFDLTTPNLKDVLAKLMIVKDMIPYVKNGVIYAIDKTKRNGEFDKNPEYVNFITGNYSSSDYCDSLKRNYSEAISDESSCRYTEYLGFRNYNNALMTLENMKIETRNPIYKINKMYLCYYKTYTIYDTINPAENYEKKIFLCKQDITPLVKLNTERNLLSQDWDKFANLNVGSDIYDLSKFKMMTVGYDIGSKSIEGWGTKYQYPEEKAISIWKIEKTYIENLFTRLDDINPFGIYDDDYLLDGKNKKRYAISFKPDFEALISPATNDSLKLKTFFFEIDYQGFYNGTTIHSKDIGRDDIVINDNPNSGLTFLEKDGLHQKEQLNRFGNKVVTITARYDDISQLQPLGSVLNLEDEKDIIIYHREYSIYDKTIMVSYVGSQDYVLKNYHTSVYAKHRTWSLMNYNEAVNRAENKKNFIYLSKDKSYYENNDNIFLNNIKNEVLLSCFTENDENFNNIINFGIIQKDNDYYCSDINVFSNGYSIGFNIAMLNNISVGTYIEVFAPHMKEDYDNWITDVANEAVGDLNLKQILSYAKMGGVEGDYTGSLQKDYMIVDDVETGFIKKLGLFVGNYDKNLFYDKKPINNVDGTIENIRLNTYYALFSLPQLLWDCAVTSTSNYDVNIDEMTFINHELIKNAIKEEKKNDIDDFEVSLTYREDIKVSPNSVLEFYGKGSTNFSTFHLRDNVGNIILNTKRENVLKNIADLYDYTSSKVGEKYVVLYKVLEKHAVQKSESNGNNYVSISDGSTYWCLAYEGFEEPKYDVSTVVKNKPGKVVYLEDIFYDKENDESYKIPDIIQDIPYDSKFDKTIENWYDMGSFKTEIYYYIPVCIQIRLKPVLNIGDNPDKPLHFGWNFDDAYNNSYVPVTLQEMGLGINYVKEDKELVIADQSKIYINVKSPVKAMSNVIGNNYEIFKDNKEKIDMTYQIEPITRENDILFSQWFLKLCDLKNTFDKKDVSIVKEPTQNILNQNIDLYTMTYKTNQGEYYPVMFVVINKDYFLDENNGFSTKTPFKTEVVYSTSSKGTSQQIYKYRCQFERISFVNKVEGDLYFQTNSDEYFYGEGPLDNKIAFDNKDDVLRRFDFVKYDETNNTYVFRCDFENVKKIYVKGSTWGEDKIPYFEDETDNGWHWVCKFIATDKKVRSTKTFVPEECRHYDVDEEGRKVILPDGQTEETIKLLKKENETIYKNMYICFSKEKMAKTLVYDQYYFANNFMSYTNYLDGDVVIYNERLYQCIKPHNEFHFIPEYWEDISETTYLKDGHLYKVGWSEKDWENIDLKLTDYKVSDVIKVEKDSKGAYIKVDLIKKAVYDTPNGITFIALQSDNITNIVTKDIRNNVKDFDILIEELYITENGTYNITFQYENWYVNGDSIIDITHPLTKTSIELFDAVFDKSYEEVKRHYPWADQIAINFSVNYEKERDLFDLTEYNSVQYWYENNGALNFVFGTNISEKEKENKEVKIYASILSSRDERVYDEAHNIIGTIWNYASKDNKLFGVKQLFDNHKDIHKDEYQLIGKTTNNIVLKLEMNGEQIDLEKTNYVKPGSIIKVEITSNEGYFIDSLTVNETKYNIEDFTVSKEFEIVVNAPTIVKVTERTYEYKTVFEGNQLIEPGGNYKIATIYDQPLKVKTTVRVKNITEGTDYLDNTITSTFENEGEVILYGKYEEGNGDVMEEKVGTFILNLMYPSNYITLNVVSTGGLGEISGDDYEINLEKVEIYIKK